MCLDTPTKTLSLQHCVNLAWPEHVRTFPWPLSQRNHFRRQCSETFRYGAVLRGNAESREIISLICHRLTPPQIRLVNRNHVSLVPRLIMIHGALASFHIFPIVSSNSFLLLLVRHLLLLAWHLLLSSHRLAVT